MKYLFVLMEKCHVFTSISIALMIWYVIPCRWTFISWHSLALPAFNNISFFWPFMRTHVMLTISYKNIFCAMEYKPELIYCVYFLCRSYCRKSYYIIRLHYHYIDINNSIDISLFFRVFRKPSPLDDYSISFSYSTISFVL